MINVAVIEDEAEAAETLLRFLDRYGTESGHKFTAQHFLNAITFLEGYKPVYDVVFMDILLPSMNGMNASFRLRELDKKVKLVFVTNMVQFAIKGYAVDALDFIVKPVVYDAFAMKMDRIVRACAKSFGTEVYIPYDGSVKVVSANNIAYIEVINHDLYYHTDGGAIRARGSLSTVEKKLAADDFVRCNISCLMNLRYVRDVRGDNIFINGKTIRISRAKKKEFLRALACYLGKGV